MVRVEAAVKQSLGRYLVHRVDILSSKNQNLKHMGRRTGKLAYNKTLQTFAPEKNWQDIGLPNKFI